MPKCDSARPDFPEDGKSKKSQNHRKIEIFKIFQNCYPVDSGHPATSCELPGVQEAHRTWQDAQSQRDNNSGKFGKIRFFDDFGDFSDFRSLGWPARPTVGMVHLTCTRCHGRHARPGRPTTRGVWAMSRATGESIAGVWGCPRAGRDP